MMLQENPLATVQAPSVKNILVGAARVADDAIIIVNNGDHQPGISGN